MTTCAECRYHHDRGCYIAPVSVFRLATAPACAQIATIAPGTAFPATQGEQVGADGRKNANAIPNPKENDQ